MRGCSLPAAPCRRTRRALQASQVKLAHMLGSCQAMFLSAWRLSKLYEAGRMTHEMASTVKAWNTRTGREVVSMGRELLGGNGIVSDFLVAKAGPLPPLLLLPPPPARMTGWLSRGRPCCRRSATWRRTTRTRGPGR